MWEVGAPRVGALWETHAPFHFLFIGDAPYGFWRRYLSIWEQDKWRLRKKILKKIKEKKRENNRKREKKREKGKWGLLDLRFGFSYVGVQNQTLGGEIS